MTPSEYPDATRLKIGAQSDYELAKRLDVNNGWVSMWRKGERGIPLDVAFKIAVALELDPAEVVADLERQRTKNPKRRAFWESFTSHARTAVLVGLCMLGLNFSGICANAEKLLSGSAMSLAALVAVFRRRLFA